jgi:hypothetical protein
MIEPERLEVQSFDAIARRVLEKGRARAKLESPADAELIDRSLRQLDALEAARNEAAKQGLGPKGLERLQEQYLAVAGVPL